MSAARRPGPVTLAEIDPDFEQAFVDLREKVGRYRRLAPLIAEARFNPMKYQDLGAMKAERSAIYGDLHSKAETMQIGSAYALMMLIEVTASLVRQVRGREKMPPVQAVLMRLADYQAWAEQAAHEAEAEAVIAERFSRQAADKVSWIGQVRQYVEASLG